MRIPTERLARLAAEAGGFVLLPHGPPAGARAHSARALLPVDQDQHGTEQNYGLLKAPVLVQSLCLQKPARSEALGLI